MAVRWAIIGIGRHSDRRMALAINQATNSRLVAVFSREMGRATAFAEKHGAKKAYDSVTKLLSDPEVDAVYIATPHSLHATQTILAANAGKHVLCEKPMALSVADCKAMIEACRKNGVKLGVGFQLRHHPAHIEARRLIASGEIGEVVLAKAQWASGMRGVVESTLYRLTAWWADLSLAGGGSIVGGGVHAIDLLRFLMGCEVKEVIAFTDSQTEERPLEDTAVALLKFENDAYGFLLSSRRIPDPDNDFVVYGSRCKLCGVGTLGTELKGELHVISDTQFTKAQFWGRDMYVAEIEAFCRAIESGGEPNASGLDGLRVAQITEALLESNRRGRAVKISNY